MALATDQTTFFCKVLETEGILFSGKYQIIGSEAVKLASIAGGPSKPLPNGFVMFNPISRAAKFAKFEELWLKLKADDIIGVAATARYSLDKFKVLLADGKA